MNGLKLVGSTPLVKLESFSRENVDIYAKLEMYNPGGSIKDRLAKYITEHLIKEGQVAPGDTLVEATAGNTGIGLALACNYHELNLVIFAPEEFSEEKISIIKALGAEVTRTERRHGMTGAQKEAREFAAANGFHYVDQFNTPLNPEAYKDTLAKEILQELDSIDHFVCGAGSGGTFSGVSSVFHPLGIKNIVVEPEGSILSGGESGSHDTEGIGVESWPPFMPRELVDDIIVISDAEAFGYVRKLARQEGLLCGSSSGAALAGAVKLAEKLDHGTIVTVFPDSSDRYMSKNIFTYGGIQ